jgi:hypothetical protein
MDSLDWRAPIGGADKVLGLLPGRHIGRAAHRIWLDPTTPAADGMAMITG